jgi:tryptophan 2,3-dioxygenase
MSGDDDLTLRERMARPIYNRILKQWVGRGELEYEVYLKTETLLHLQYPPDQLVIHEELMFQITHQAQELWLKLLCEEGLVLVDEFGRGDVWKASGRIERMVRIMQTLAYEMRALSTLTPQEFQVIRRSLGTGSGQESPGFNRLTHVLADGIEEALSALIARRGVTLAAVYGEPSAAPDLLRICEQLIDLDQVFQEWLLDHFLLVRRTIGVDRSVNALDGFPTHALLNRALLPLFRSLWDVRIELTKHWAPGGGYPVGADRTKPPAPPNGG